MAEQASLVEGIVQLPLLKTATTDARQYIAGLHQTCTPPPEAQLI